jgi:hypothetical protein
LAHANAVLKNDKTRLAEEMEDGYVFTSFGFSCGSGSGSGFTCGSGMGMGMGMGVGLSAWLGFLP